MPRPWGSQRRALEKGGARSFAGFLGQTFIQAALNEHLLCAGCSENRVNQEGSPFWSLSPSLGLGPAVTHLTTGPAFRWGLKEPERPYVSTPSRPASLAQKSSRGMQGSWAADLPQRPLPPPGETSLHWGLLPQGGNGHLFLTKTSGSLEPQCGSVKRAAGSASYACYSLSGLMPRCPLSVFPHRGHDHKSPYFMRL